MSDATDEFGAPPPDPFDAGGDEPQEEQDAEAGGPPPPPEEHGGEDGTPLPPDDDGEGQEQARAANPNAGKRIVLVAEQERGPYSVVGVRRAEGAEPEIVLYEGDDKAARLAVLEQFDSLAQKAAAGELWLVTVPASSWKPKQPKPRPRKTDWSV